MSTLNGNSVDVLQNLGFIQANEPPASKSDFLTFKTGEIDDLTLTIAVDKDGGRWCTFGKVDLTSHGFLCRDDP